MRQKKGILTLRALLSTILMITLVFIVFKVGNNAAEAAFGGNTLEQSFNNLIKDINEMKVGEHKEVIISLNTKTALIGFSKGKDYQCYGCTGAKDNLNAVFKHPPNKECASSACVCLCLEGLPSIAGSTQPLSITCTRLECRSIIADIAGKVELGELVAKKYGSGFNKWSSWRGGFLYARNVGEVDALISGLPKNSDAKTIAILEKKLINDEDFIGICPELPCIQEQK